MEYLIGIDIGTTNVKVVASTLDGKTVAVEKQPTTIIRTGPGSSEFDLNSIVRAVMQSVRTITDRLPDQASIVAAGIVSIGESIVGLGGDCEPVTFCPTWFDRRTRNERKTLKLSIEDWYEPTGMIDDDIYSIWRIRWMNCSDPEMKKRVRIWVNVADYCVQLLTGEAVASPSLAARTGLMDRRTLAWSDDLVKLAELNLDSLPRLSAQAEIAGHVSSDGARRSGLAQGTPIVNVGHDHPAAAVGCGLRTSGPVMDSTGTAEALATFVPRALTFQETLGGKYDCYPGPINGHHVLSGHLPSSGSLLGWIADSLALNNGTSSTEELIEALLEEASSSPIGAGGVRVLPFLEGSGAPFNVRSRSAAIVGLKSNHGRAEIVRAALEGTAYWLRLNLNHVDAIADTCKDYLIATGGAVRNYLWLEIKAAMTGRRLRVIDVPEAAALGSAIVAGLAVGAINDDGSLPDTKELTHREVRPKAEESASYEPVAEEYEGLFKGYPSSGWRATTLSST
jgi:sugar (pentulose or hexulose) kinase